MLYADLEQLCDSLSSGNKRELFGQGVSILIRHKNEGYSQDKTIETLSDLLVLYRYEDNDELKYELISRLLDCVVGQKGSKDAQVYASGMVG